MADLRSLSDIWCLCGDYEIIDFFLYVSLFREGCHPEALETMKISMKPLL